MDLSVTILCKNAEKYIHNLLDSIQRQSTKYNVEYIFFCDRCTDDTCNIINATLVGSNLNYKVYESEDITYGDAAALLTGQFVWFLRAEDWLTQTNSINKLVKFMYKEETPYARLCYTTAVPSKVSFNTLSQYCFQKDYLMRMCFGHDVNDLLFNIFNDNSPYNVPKLLVPIYSCNSQRMDINDGD